ncbi:MAG: 2-oxoacid:acceptor oxidoreductase subunit alpha [bacterium]
MSRRVLSGLHFMQGDVASAEGAIAAGCTFFAGYPITPASEIAERMARRLPEVGGTYVQMEDEIGSIAAVVGASWTGTKAMTATSGPGISLMLENIGYAIATETPCVIVNVQRGAPSTGTPSLPLQGDILQARRGSHGEYEVIALAPSSPREMFDLSIEAFNLAEKFRTPVFILADAFVGHMREEVLIPDPSKIRIVERKIPASGMKFSEYKSFLDEDIAPMPIFGQGFKSHVTASTHDSFGKRNVTDPEALDYYIRCLNNKIRKHKEEIVLVDSEAEGSEVVLVSYGSTYRVVRQVQKRLREDKINVGTFRLISIWPFPQEKIEDLARKVKTIILLENNLGQLLPYVKAAAKGEAEVVFLSPHLLGTLHNPDTIVKKIKEIMP